MKTIMLLLDGLGDRPHKELGGKTPLEYASTPNLDLLSTVAETGMMIPWVQGRPIGTDVAHFILFGYDMKDFPGRGIINVLSSGFELKQDSAYLLCTWSSVEEKEGLLIKERWAKDLSLDEIEQLKTDLCMEIDGLEFKWHYSHGPHGIIEISGENVSHEISDSDPFYEDKFVLRVEPYETDSENAKHTATALNKYLREVYMMLKDHDVNHKRIEAGKLPANFLLSKWSGKKPDIDSFKELNGMSSVIIGNSELMGGLAKLFSMDYIEYSDLSEGIDSALESDCEYVHLHTKDTDEAAHTKKPMNKVYALEEIDKKLSKLIENSQNEELLLVVTGDHTTPSSGPLIHSGEAVPIMFIGKNVRVDDVDSFGERSCARGSIRMNGKDLMQMMLNYSDKAQFYNLRPGTKKLRYISDTLRKFEL